MTKTKKVSIGVASAILFSVAWYCVAADYSYRAVSGTYRFERVGEVSTLVLRKDGSFLQELSHGGKGASANGIWRRIGEGGIVLSKDFLLISGQEARSTGEIDGEVRKSYGLFMSIYFNPDPGGPVFRKVAFH